MISDFNKFMKEHNLAYDDIVNEHYTRHLALAEKQKICLNPNYPKNILPDEIVQLSLSTLNPLSQVNILPGSNILDIGCGAGADCFLASKNTDKVYPHQGLNF